MKTGGVAGSATSPPMASSRRRSNPWLAETPWPAVTIPETSNGLQAEATNGRGRPRVPADSGTTQREAATTTGLHQCTGWRSGPPGLLMRIEHRNLIRAAGESTMNAAWAAEVGRESLSRTRATGTRVRLVAVATTQVGSTHGQLAKHHQRELSAMIALGTEVGAWPATAGLMTLMRLGLIARHIHVDGPAMVRAPGAVEARKAASRAAGTTATSADKTDDCWRQGSIGTSINAEIRVGAAVTKGGDSSKVGSMQGYLAAHQQELAMIAPGRMVMVGADSTTGTPQTRTVFASM